VFVTAGRCYDLVRHHRANDRIFLYAFDLIELNGDDLGRDPLEGRKATLEMMLAKAGPGIRFNEHIEGDGETVFRHACKMGLEGIVSKRRDSACRSGRSPDWLKNSAAPAISISRSPKASRLLLRTARELGTAGGAKVATVMGHARPDTANVRQVLLAEPHRVRFTGRALLRGPLLRGDRPRRKREREAQQHRSRGCDRPELWLGATNVHYRPPFCSGFSCQFKDHGKQRRQRTAYVRASRQECRSRPPAQHAHVNRVSASGDVHAPR
jgi:hypothetical protein